MRKLLASFLLPLILLLTQQGALVHELSHHLGTGAAVAFDAAAGESGPESPDAPSTPPSTKHTLCALCLAFDHLASAVAGPLAAPVLLDLRHAAAFAAALTWRDQAAPTARSRGPPTVL